MHACIANSEQPSFHSNIDCLDSGVPRVLFLHFHLGYKATCSGSHLILRNAVMYHIKPNLIVLQVQKVFTDCWERAILFSYCAQIHLVVTGAMMGIKGHSQSHCNLHLFCNVQWQGAQLSRHKFRSLANIDFASLCIKLYKNNVLVMLNHVFSLQNDVIPLNILIVLYILSQAEYFKLTITCKFYTWF